MTNKLAALAMLSRIACPERIEALDDFYCQYKDNFLLLNKWFLLQSISSLPGTLDEVKRLFDHEAFDIKNPNKVRALIGGFAANRLHFHDISGAGYEFLADVITQLNGINPIVASRIITPLTRWKNHMPQRVALMKAQLERLLQIPSLAPDLFEIITKSLEQ